jgi:acyl-[acyl-carrier-protein]-phospholipid O-acyltransferase/long-chain-fatty-acid--[acyl-carrier-protein] ligase
METMSTPKPAGPARFGAYLYTQFCSAFNDNVHQMTVALYLIHVSGGREGEAGGWQAIVGAAFVLPFILFSPLAGSLADRHNKRSVLIVSKCLEVIPMSVSVFSTILPAPMQYYGLILAIFLMETRAAFFSPAKYGILPEVTAPEFLVRANGILQMLTMVAIVSGEAAGGFLYQHLALRRTLLICLGIAVVGSLLTPFIPSGAPGNRTQRLQLNPVGGIWGTLREMRFDKLLLTTVFTLSSFWMVSAIFRQNIPVFGRFALKITPGETSLLWAIVSVGIGAGAALAGIVKRAEDSMRLVLPGALGMSLASLAAGLWGKSFTSAALILGLLGVFGGLYLVPQTSIFQERSPAERRGAYLALQNFVNYTFMFIAAGIFYLLSKVLELGSNVIFMIVGAGIAAVGIGQAFLMPHLLLGRPNPEPAKERA